MITFDRIVVSNLPGLPGDAKGFRALLVDALTSQFSEGLFAGSGGGRGASPSQPVQIQLERSLDDQALARQLARSLASTAREQI